jgi:hypothetical protein
LGEPRGLRPRQVLRRTFGLSTALRVLPIWRRATPMHRQRLRAYGIDARSGPADAALRAAPRARPPCRDGGDGHPAPTPGHVDDGTFALSENPTIPHLASSLRSSPASPRLLAVEDCLADDRPDRPRQEAEQGLRAPVGDRRGPHLRGDVSPDGETFSLLMRLFGQFRGRSRASPSAPSARTTAPVPPSPRTLRRSSAFP